MTSVFEEDAMGVMDAVGGGDVSRFRLVVGRDLPFLKKGTLTGSAEAIVVVVNVKE